MPETDTKTRTTTATKLAPPPLFRVIYINDDKTSMEFVVASLVDYFGYNESDAHQLTLDIHEQGSAVVAVLPFEIAEQKGVEVTLQARANAYPLQIKLEPEDV